VPHVHSAPPRQALLTGRPVADACSQGRRAVLSAWPEYQGSIEWSRPVLFVAEGLDGTLEMDCGDRFDLSTADERFRKTGTSPRMMLDRYDMTVAYDRLLELTANGQADKLMVAIPVEDAASGLGKTRVLEELAVRSVMDGFLPCLLRVQGEAPRSLLDFALALTDAINDTRRNFGLDVEIETQSRLCTLDELGLTPTAAERRNTLMRLRSKLSAAVRIDTDPNLVLDAIRHDCADLVEAVRAVTHLDHRVMILIDELHRWDSSYQEVLESIDFAGLGTPAAPIPVVVNYVAVNNAEGIRIHEKLKFLPGERRPVLRPFRNKTENEMVYRQLLLSEYRIAPSETRTNRERVARFFTNLHTRTGGVPGQFITPAVEGFIDGVMEGGIYLIPADFETALRQYGV
jgi:hypothetical protein